MKVGDKVYIRGDRRTAMGTYLPEQLVDGKYVKRYGTDEPWVGTVEKIDGDMVKVGGVWRGVEMYEVTGQ